MISDAWSYPNEITADIDPPMSEVFFPPSCMPQPLSYLSIVQIIWPLRHMAQLCLLQGLPLEIATDDL